MILPDPPPNWGVDEISKFFDNARMNEYATFANIQEEIHRLINIDALYRKIINGLNRSKYWFAGFFVLRTHSSYLAACRMCWSGQIPACYALLRSSLENALYGAYLSDNKDSQETWLRRHDSEEHKKKVRNEFKIRTMLDLAIQKNRKDGEVAVKLYDRTIDFGAHPNERALMQTLKMTKQCETVEFKMAYLEGDSDQLQLALKTTAQVGVCALSLFRPVYKERFDILGITDSLYDIKKGL